jgi:DNA-binding MarR family transcriptional regulator
MTQLKDQCARDLMDTAPQIMQAIRIEMRRGHGADLSIPQFRTLRFIQRNPDSSLSALAWHLGLMLPSVSKLVDGLVKEGLVLRQESPSDRRRLILALTAEGEAIVNTARANAQTGLAKALERLNSAELETVHQAMLLLQPIFPSQAGESLPRE